MGMNREFELQEIAGYPEIVPRIIDVSSVVIIRVENHLSCGFTILLDNCKCVNVYHNCDEKHAENAWMQILNLRERLISEICTVKPGFTPAMASSSDTAELPMEVGENV
jgi:hypothetical protein